jgi:hypothetical protein
LKPLGPALERLGYEPVPGAEKYQFVKPGPTGGREGCLKFDLLTGPRSCFTATKAKVDDRRVRPRPSVGVHAHHVDEAMTLEEGLLALRFQGQTSAGVEHESNIYLPHPLTFAMMKLFAFRDWAVDENKASAEDPKKYGRYHALDLYTVIATTSEEEWNQARELRSRFGGELLMKEAVQIVNEHFATRTSLGMIRMRESGYYRDELQTDDFLGALHELFASE